MRIDPKRFEPVFRQNWENARRTGMELDAGHKSAAVDCDGLPVVSLRPGRRTAGQQSQNQQGQTQNPSQPPQVRRRVIFSMKDISA
jgi:hypothetical protein